MRQVEESRFASFDGQEIYYRRWPAAASHSRRAVLLLHRGHEHSGRVAHLVEELDLQDHDFFAWDMRGNGRTPGARGDAPAFEALVRDLDCFVGHIRVAHGIEPGNLAVVAQSAGAVVAATWVHDYAPGLRALVLASPAFEVKLYVPLAVPGLRLLHRLRGNFFVSSYVRPQWLTRDRARVDSFRADTLISPQISVRVLLGMYETARRVVADAQAIQVPTQLLVSGADFVVRREPQDHFYERLGARIKERHFFPAFRHDTLGELERGPAVARMRAFLAARFAEPALRPQLLDADRHGPSYEEAERLAWPPRPGSFADRYWHATRAGLRLAGRLSEGVALGLRTGFDSGSTLDYVYRNQARGRGALGRRIDRSYLDAIGWRGIRVRRAHLGELLRVAATRLRGAGEKVHAVDVAAGHGRYVLETLAGGEAADSILLRDFSELNVEQGRALIAELDAAGLARFERGDAFDRDGLAALTPRPTLAIVSGLYELFADNDLVRRSLAGLGAAVPLGGYLVYTGQPWHPQLEFIARVLTSHRGGAAWVMRRRSQAELDQLVETAGFRKLEQRIDEWGIFTVSLAQRVAD